MPIRMTMNSRTGRNSNQDWQAILRHCLCYFRPPSICVLLNLASEVTYNLQFIYIIFRFSVWPLRYNRDGWRNTLPRDVVILRRTLFLFMSQSQSTDVTSHSHRHYQYARVKNWISSLQLLFNNNFTMFYSCDIKLLSLVRDLPDLGVTRTVACATWWWL